MNCYPAPVGCGREITPEELDTWDSLSQREFEISGLCMDPCQGIYFAEEDDSDEPWVAEFHWDESPD